MLIDNPNIFLNTMQLSTSSFVWFSFCSPIVVVAIHFFFFWGRTECRHNWNSKFGAFTERKPILLFIDITYIFFFHFSHAIGRQCEVFRQMSKHSVVAPLFVYFALLSNETLLLQFNEFVHVHWDHLRLKNWVFNYRLVRGSFWKFYRNYWN